MANIKEIKRKEFIKSMSKYYLGAFEAGINYFIVTNMKSFDKSFIVAEPSYMAKLLDRSEHLEDLEQAKDLKDKLTDIRKRVSDNSRSRAKIRWQDVSKRT